MPEPQWRTAILEDHMNRDQIPAHRGFAARYKKAKGGDPEKAERDLEKRIAKEQGVTHPAKVSGDVMTREKERYLESL